MFCGRWTAPIFLAPSDVTRLPRPNWPDAHWMPSVSTFRLPPPTQRQSFYAFLFITPFIRTFLASAMSHQAPGRYQLEIVQRAFPRPGHGSPSVGSVMARDNPSDIIPPLSLIFCVLPASGVVIGLEEIRDLIHRQKWVYIEQCGSCVIIYLS